MHFVGVPGTLPFDWEDTGRVSHSWRAPSRDVFESSAGTGVVVKVSPNVEECFIKHALSMEAHGFIRPIDVLARNGVPLPSPDELDDAGVHDALWKLIHACAEHRLYLYRTDHLSDHELYSYLWSEGLRREVMGFGLPNGNVHLDVIGSGNDEDTLIALRFYYDEDDRESWSREFPEFPIPPRQRLPYDRDRYLPKVAAE